MYKVPCAARTKLAAVPGYFAARVAGCGCLPLSPFLTAAPARCLGEGLPARAGVRLQREARALVVSCISQEAAQVSEALPGTCSDSENLGKSTSTPRTSRAQPQNAEQLPRHMETLQSPCLSFWLQMECSRIPVGKEKQINMCF